MNEETKNQSNSCGGCLCEGAGPALSEFLRRIGPPPEAKRHFDSARVEILKGIRSLIDQRINDIGRQSESKGASITVE
jgi:hypothetical protein